MNKNNSLVSFFLFTEVAPLTPCTKFFKPLYQRELINDGLKNVLLLNTKAGRIAYKVATNTKVLSAKNNSMRYGMLKIFMLKLIFQPLLIKQIITFLSVVPSKI